MNGKRICVIGAGPSGLVATKTLAEAGLDPVCIDMSSVVGGQWVIDNPNGRSAAYHSLHTNTPRRMSRFSDFEIPEDWPEFLPAGRVVEWLQSYVEHFGLQPRLRLRTEVVHAAPVGEQGWKVQSRTEDGVVADELFDGIVVASGTYWQPRCPDWARAFTGDLLHAQSYRSPREPIDLSGKNVVVVGIGNTACEVAVEIARGGAGSVTLSARSGTWIIPKTINGVSISSLAPMTHPKDRVLPIFRLVPPGLRQRVFAAVARPRFRKSLGSLQARFAQLGLPPAPMDPLSTRPTVAQDLLPALEAGEISARGAVTGVDGQNLTFADGEVQYADAVICATGYHLAFPFLDPSIADTRGDDLRLFCRTMSPARADLFFVGLGRPSGAFWPIAEAQSRLAAATFAGTYLAPAKRELARLARPVMTGAAFNPALYGLEMNEELHRGAVRARRAWVASRRRSRGSAKG